jgi:large subunit ribosomal protein L22
MSVQAIARGVRISPRKAGLVASLVRGRSVEDALVILDHTPKKAAPIIKKVIVSATANATTNHNLQEKGLTITELTVSPGPALKRFRPAARGGALRYRHPSSHIRVVVDGATKKPSTKASKSKTARKPAAKENK